MTLDWKKARELCTEAEFALVSAARAAALRSMTQRLVRMKVVRARGLRDKFRDLADRQAREAKGKLPPRGRSPARGNARTVQKAELFGELLRRFEMRAAELEAAAKPPPAPPSRRRTARRASSPATPTRRARARRAARPPTEASVATARRQAADARKVSKLKGSHVPRLHSHVSSRNKRNQARRDARR